MLLRLKLAIRLSYIYVYSVYSGKVISGKDALEEGECRNFMQNIVLSLLSRDYLEVWTTMMGNERFMIVIYYI